MRAMAPKGPALQRCCNARGQGPLLQASQPRRPITPPLPFIACVDAGHEAAWSKQDLFRSAPDALTEFHPWFRVSKCRVGRVGGSGLAQYRLEGHMDSSAAPECHEITPADARLVPAIRLVGNCLVPSPVWRLPMPPLYRPFSCTSLISLLAIVSPWRWRQSDANTSLIILESRSIGAGGDNEATLEGSTKNISILITTMCGNFVDRPVFVG